MRYSIAIAAALCLAGCATTRAAPDEAFFASLQRLCGQAYEGRVVSTDAADADMRAKRLVMHVRECSADEIRIPFHVGDDRSRTWIVRSMRIILTGTRRRTGSRSGERTGFWLQLKHDHRHADGSPDVLTDYGGESFTGSSARREFPADEFSKTLFAAKGNPASVANVWAMEVVPSRMFAYELRRPGRYVRVEFDLSRPVGAPPPPWGAS